MLPLKRLYATTLSAPLRTTPHAPESSKPPSSVLMLMMTLSLKRLLTMRLWLAPRVTCTPAVWPEAREKRIVTLLASCWTVKPVRHPTGWSRHWLSTATVPGEVSVARCSMITQVPYTSTLLPRASWISGGAPSPYDPTTIGHSAEPCQPIVRGPRHEHPRFSSSLSPGFSVKSAARATLLNARACVKPDAESLPVLQSK